MSDHYYIPVEKVFHEGKERPGIFKIGLVHGPFETLERAQRDKDEQEHAYADGFLFFQGTMVPNEKQSARHREHRTNTNVPMFRGGHRRGK